MRPWFGHLRLKVLAFGIAMSVLPVALYGWYGLAAARASQVEIVQAQNQAAAHTVAEELARFVGSVTARLELLARLEGGRLLEAPAAEQERVLYTLLRDTPYLEEVSLVGADGVEVARASRREVVAGQPPAAHGHEPYWAALRRGEATVGPVTFDLQGRPLFTVGVPLPARAGALVARPTLRGLVDNLAAVQADGRVTTHVLDGDGRLIGDSDYSLVLAGFRWDRQVPADTPYRSLTGDEAFGYLVEVPGLDWRVLAETTVDQAMAPVRRLAWEFAGGALLLVSVVVGLSIVFGLQLTVPLERLEAGAVRVGAGDLTVRIPPGGRDEIGRLVDAFNQMTEKLRIQDANLRAERDRLDTAVSAMGAGLALIDARGRILWANRHLLEWFPAAVVGGPCRGVLGRNCDGDAGCAPDGEYRVRVGGHDRVFRYRTYRIAGAGPDDPARLEVVEDVTERRAMEQMVLQSEKLAAVGQLAAGVAHEINNPLAIISAYAEDLADRLRDEGAAALERDGELSAYLTQLQVQVQRCKGITANLLDFARRGPAEPEPVDVIGVARATAALVAPRARKAGVALSVEVRDGLPAVRASRDQLQQVFLNLVTNALDAIEEGGGSQVSIMAVAVPAGQATAGAAGAVLRVGVRDDGPGMSEAVAGRALEPFFTTKPPGRGTGLGLSTCYGIVTGLGGRLWLESRPGLGTTVWFELPVWEGE
ncbi:ATP-binding protein [Symbiobacterium terraclitae]|uniref:ATP-binding protein n=1 Tax=Symbiobacterium terraclitae TaxID=557451 RepID=UPI0035B53964